MAEFAEIRGNDFNLSISRYVDTFEKEEEIGIDAVQVEIDDLEKEFVEVRKKMAEKLQPINRGILNGKKQKIEVLSTEISVQSNQEEDYIALTEIARYKNQDRSDYLVRNWLAFNRRTDGSRIL